MKTIHLPADYYQQFDADFNLDVPAESYGGWKTEDIEISLPHTALVVMHAWDFGTRQEYLGWHRAVEYIPRAQEICQEILPEILLVVRDSEMPVFHVVSGDYAKDYPGYKKAVPLAGELPPQPELICSDPVLENLRRFRSQKVFVGAHNQEDVARAFENLDFPETVKPVGDEGIAKDGHQLFALCRDAGVNHLIYTGFAINWCLLLSPGGMAEMQSRGFMCSAIRQAVTAVENRETVRGELCKQIALWRVAVSFGFVFDSGNFVSALRDANSMR